MKAAIFHGPNQPLEIGEVQLSDPGPHEVVVRTACAGICHSDLHFVEGTYPMAGARRAGPRVRGHRRRGRQPVSTT